MRSNAALLAVPAFLSANPTSVTSIALAAGDAAKIRAASRLDALDSWYSGVVSLAQAASGITEGRHGWSTVKLYYAAFYFMRAMLLAEGWCQFHIQRKPRAIEAKSGKVAVKLTGTSHESCFELFSSVFSSSPLVTQLIGVDAPSEWLKGRREKINYNVPRLPDPDPPEWFEKHVSNGVREMLSVYFGSPNGYASLAEHAMLAFPVASAVETADRLRSEGIFASEDDVFDVRKFWKDKKGQLPGFDKIIPSRS